MHDLKNDSGAAQPSIPAEACKAPGTPSTQSLSRREALRWILAASATISVLDARSFAANPVAAKGYGTDPNLLQVYKPGDVWPLTFTPPQRELVAALCDTLLPADEKSPSASQLKVPEFIDEWISAPYPAQQRDRKQVLRGLDWMDRESRKRFHTGFAQLSEAQRVQICDDICDVRRARAAYRTAARFFDTFRNLALGGFYSTPEGMRDVQYVGNVPLARFDGPPPAVLEFLKL